MGDYALLLARSEADIDYLAAGLLLALEPAKHLEQQDRYQQHPQGQHA